jgi:protein-disulfide isomerase
VATLTEQALSWMLTGAAVVMAGVLVRGEFRRSTPADVSRGGLRFEKQWNEFRNVGIEMSDDDAPITVTEFADLECPACRGFQPILDSIRVKYGHRIAFLFVHMPLPIHRFARIAAQAAECAGAQGRFAPFTTVAYAKQDSLGLTPWPELAREAGVVDTVTFEACLQNPTPARRIDEGFRLGESLRLRGTPTVFVNGWEFLGTPSADQISGVIDALLSGRAPNAT